MGEPQPAPSRRVDGRLDFSSDSRSSAARSRPRAPGPGDRPDAVAEVRLGTASPPARRDLTFSAPPTDHGPRPSAIPTWELRHHLTRVEWRSPALAYEGRPSSAPAL